MISQTVQSAPVAEMQDEQILVVKRSLLPALPYQGIQKSAVTACIAAIQEHKEFLPRALMETDPRYKQIIPYLIFTYENRYFLMQRQAKATEIRLQSKWSLGIGGHIRQEDIEGDDIVRWAQREFHEEVDYNGSLTVTPIGILNDDTNPVGQVHVGLVYLLQGDSPAIKVKSELKSGELLTLEECAHYYESMETWTQIIFDTLYTRTRKRCC
jgi:predicted NUDIX family phosphoesterase